MASLWASCFLVACADPAALTDDQNERTGGPKIVSLNPCLDAIAVEVANPAQILALSHFSRDPGSSSVEPEIAAQFAITGGTAEEVIALAPDIVLASNFIAPATKSALERAGLRVETFGVASSVEDSFAQIDELATLIGRTSQGAALTQEITAQMRQTKPGNVTAMLWQPGQIVPGDNTLVWEHLRRFGLINHAAQMGLDQADHVSLEAVLANPPDLLLIAGDAPGQSHPLLDQLESTHVARFDPKLFYCGGPSMVQAWERLEDIQRAFNTDPPGGIVHDAR